MKTYELKFEVRVSDNEVGFYTHNITFRCSAKNQLEAINKGIESLDLIITSSWEEETISKNIGREFKVKSFELAKIISVKLIKGGN